MVVCQSLLYFANHMPSFTFFFFLNVQLAPQDHNGFIEVSNQLWCPDNNTRKRMRGIL